MRYLLAGLSPRLAAGSGLAQEEHLHMAYPTFGDRLFDHSLSELQPPEYDATPGPTGGGDSVLQGSLHLAGRELVAIDLAVLAGLLEGVGNAEREFDLL